MAVLLSELERTGAFDRKVLVIVPTTGTGWINPVAARSLEMMYNGDTAMVGSQYSYLPSWISFLGDRREVDGLRPADDRRRSTTGGCSYRPTTGPSWCSTAKASARWPGQGAFGWLPDIARMGFSSVLWVGPPQRQPAVEGDHRAARPRHAGGRAALRQRAHRAVLAGHRHRGDRARHRGAVGGHPGAVPAAPVGPDRVVVAGSAVQPAGLAEGTAGPRPHARRCAGIRSSRSGRSPPT